MERCKSIWAEIGSLCVLPQGHEGKHIFPNSILKDAQPMLFDKMQAERKPMSQQSFDRYLSERPSLELVFTFVEEQKS